MAHPALARFQEGRAQSVQNRIADAITDFAGSMVFVYVHVVWFALWIVFRVEDYPFGLLTMIVSLEAIFLSTFVMISQNRADAKREVLAQHQWQVIQKEDEQNQHLLTLTQRIHDLSKQIHGLQTQTLELTQAAHRPPRPAAGSGAETVGAEGAMLGPADALGRLRWATDEGAPEPMTPRVAAAPCSYGVFEITVGRPGLPDGPALVEAIADAGYAGTELGPPGYFGRGREVGALLAEHDLSSWARSCRCASAARTRSPRTCDALEATLGLLDEASEGRERPVVLLSDAFCEPDRMPLRRRDRGAPRDVARASAGSACCSTTSHRAAERCRERGFTTSFHPHAGTYVESPREVHALLEHMDPSLLGLCFDTRPLRVRRRRSARAAARGGRARQPRALQGRRPRAARPPAEARARVSRTPGRPASSASSAPAARRSTSACGSCSRSATTRWIVVEQDRVLAAGEPFEHALESAERNRAWLKERGL